MSPASSLEPHVPHAAAVAWQVLEGVEAVEVVDGEVGDSLWVGEPHVDRNPAASLRVQAQAPPAEDTAARGAEDDLQGRLLFTRPGVRSPRPEDVDAFVLVVV